jgi:hypothetical protein
MKVFFIKILLAVFLLLEPFTGLIGPFLVFFLVQVFLVALSIALIVTTAIFIFSKFTLDLSEKDK